MSGLTCVFRPAKGLPGWHKLGFRDVGWVRRRQEILKTAERSMRRNPSEMRHAMTGYATRGDFCCLQIWGSASLTYAARPILLADTKAGKNPSQQVIGAKRPGDFPQSLLSHAQVFCQQLTGTSQGQLGVAMFKVSGGLA